MSDSSKNTLSDFRKKIDQTDHEIIRLILKRIQYAKQIGAAKRESNTPVYRPDREKEVYNNVIQYAKSIQSELPLPEEALLNIYREIMSGSIAAEDGPSVAYMGPAGTFTHMACRMRFGSSVNEMAVESIPEVFRAVESGRDARYGVVPVDNTTEGSIGQTLDMLLQHNLRIYSEIYVQANHNLLYHTDIPLKSIKRLYTNKVALESCRNWLQKNLSFTTLDIIETISTAAAAKMAAEKKDGAALASQMAAESYHLTYIAKNVQDNMKNVTRFLIIGHDECPPTKDDKTSIICSVNDKPGSLYEMLRPFHDAKINLTKIESRPSRQIYGEYNFFIDFYGHNKEKKIQKILKKLSENTSFLKLLGSYPRTAPP